MSEYRNTSPYSQRRAQTYDTHGGGSSGSPYDGVEDTTADTKQSIANRAQSLRHSSESIVLGRLEETSLPPEMIKLSVPS
jgi:hypothetical protein